MRKKMNCIMLAIAIVLISNFNLNAQFYQTWSSGGNDLSGADGILGTTDASNVILKTSNEKRITINKVGDITLHQFSLLLNDGFLVHRHTGLLDEIQFTGNINDVFTGDGQFTDINTLITLSSSQWQLIGDKISNTNTGNVGIGTDDPLRHLHLKARTCIGTNCPTNNPGGSGNLSAIFRMEDEVYDGTTNNIIRNVFWDIAASGGQEGLYFSTNQGNGNSMETVLKIKETGQVIIGPSLGCAYNYNNMRLLVDGHIYMTGDPTEEPRSLYWGTDCAMEWGIEYNATDGGLNFWNPYTATGGLANYRFFLQNGTGYIGIGTKDPAYELDVCGTIRAKEVIVDLQGACQVPDYVFEADYDLMSLEDLRTYVEKEHHLPGIPSAKEVEANGINTGEMNMMLLEKVEELTLYMLEMEEKYKGLKKENVELKKLIDESN